MAASYDLKTDTAGKFRFSLKASNGEIILQSEAYNTKQSALDGIESVKTNSLLDERYEKKTSAKGEPYFNLKAANGQNLGRSEMYSSASGMENGIASVKKNAPVAVLKDGTAK